MTGIFAETLDQVRERIVRSRGARINEQNTKASLIDPVLRALDWDVEEWEEVQREFRVQSVDNPVDYALLDLDTKKPLLFIEAKALNEDLEDRRWAGQIMAYAHVAGVKWVVLTNGDEYRVYNAYADGPVEEKLFRKICVSQPDSELSSTLDLLHKSQVRKNQIELTWKAEYSDNRIRSGLESLFQPEPDTSIINLLKKRGLDLPPAEIRAALARLRPVFQSLDAPITSRQNLAARSLLARGSRSKSKAQGSRDESKISLALLIETGLITPPLQIEAEYAGCHLVAQIESDGDITFDGRTFKSLSVSGGTAKAELTGPTPGRTYKSTDGWRFWHFRDEDARLRPMDVLRSRYRNRES